MERIEVLARRVRWLDRARRPLAVITAVIGGPLLTLRFGDMAGDDWPVAHLWALGAMLVVTIWLATETVLAVVAALWDTQHSQQLAQSRMLPVARLVSGRQHRRL